mgnify:CR=1 FL=1
MQDVKRANLIELTDLDANIGLNEHGAAHIVSAAGLYDSAKETMELRKDVLVKTEDDAIRFASTRVTTLIVIGFAVSAIVTTLCVCLALNLRHSLGETVRVMEAMTKGDLTQRLVVNSTDELGRMGAAVNRAIEATRDRQRETRRIFQLSKQSPRATN